MTVLSSPQPCSGCPGPARLTCSICAVPICAACAIPDYENGLRLCDTCFADGEREDPGLDDAAVAA